MDAQQQQRRFVPFLCDRNPSSLHPPPSSGATGSYGPVGTVLKIVSTLQLNQTHSNSASTNTSGDESRLISCFELLMLRKRFFISGTADLEVGPPLFVHGPPVFPWLITTQISAKMLQIHLGSAQSIIKIERFTLQCSWVMEERVKFISKVRIL